MRCMHPYIHTSQKVESYMAAPKARANTLGDSHFGHPGMIARSVHQDLRLAIVDNTSLFHVYIYAHYEVGVPMISTGCWLF